uniref:FHA domain-containing protein n=1 Tax=Leersia perrieri TaxID=77586 RepID=A0A0D9XRY3_9ORYZ
MGNPRRPSAAAAASDLEVGFAKLQGENFEYYMQTYSIVLGRLSKRPNPNNPHPNPNPPSAAAADDVDVDLGILGGGRNVSRRHARIFYDFARRRFALEVLGKNGCLVEGVLHVPGGEPVKLDSQDLLQMGDARFYFLLPTRSVFATDAAARRGAAAAVTRAAPVVAPPPPPSSSDDDDEEEEEDGEEEDDDGEGMAVMKKKRLTNGEDGALSGRKSGKSGAGSKGYRQADDLQLLQLEEKDVISSTATVLSDLCGPQDWVPMNKLHEVMFEKYGDLWHHNRVRKYLTSEDWPETETDGRPWHGLSLLLRKYPEHFVINIRMAGGQGVDFVSLVSLQP